jgi:hypothetical protein
MVARGRRIDVRAVIAGVIGLLLSCCSQGSSSVIANWLRIVEPNCHVNNNAAETLVIMWRKGSSFQAKDDSPLIRKGDLLFQRLPSLEQKREFVRSYRSFPPIGPTPDLRSWAILGDCREPVTCAPGSPKPNKDVTRGNKHGWVRPDERE